MLPKSLISFRKSEHPREYRLTSNTLELCVCGCSAFRARLRERETEAVRAIVNDKEEPLLKAANWSKHPKTPGWQVKTYSL